MAINENEALWLIKGEKQYLLLCADDRYHLITLNQQCSKKRALKILTGYPCSEQELQQMGIKFTTILKKDVFGVRVEGNTAGSEFMLRVINQNTRKYTLHEDILPEAMEGMFADVRRLPEPRDNAVDAWRKKEQDPQMLKQMKKVKLGLNIAAVMFGLLSTFGVRPHLLWTGLFLLVPVGCILLAILLPAYFTLLDWDDKRKTRYGIGLTMPMILSLLFLSLEYLWVDYLSFAKFFVYSFVCGGLISMLLLLFVKEFRQRIGFFVLLAIIIATMCGSSVVGYLNEVLDTSGTQTQTYTVEKLNSSTGRTTSYYCYITMEDGEESSIRVSKATYQSLSVGDKVQVAHREGGLGLEYIYLVEE